MAEALEQLVREHHEALYRYAYRLTGSAADAEDLAQQTFLAACQHLGQVRAMERVRGWLFTVLRNAYLKARRRAPLRLASEFAVEIDLLPDTASPEPFYDQELLRGALAELPDEFRLVLLMFFFEELSYKEIAEQLEIPLGTVMSRLSRAKAHLRQRLAREPHPAVSR